MSSGGPSTQQPQQSRLQETLGQLPLCTTAVTGVCIILHIFATLLGWNIAQFAINAGTVVYAHEYYRLLTSAYFHSGLMHIGMNMMSFLAIGAWLEMHAGTLYLLWTIIWSTLLSNGVYVAACWGLAMATGDYSWLSYTSIGFSGVLFTLAVLESRLSGHSTRSVMGLFSVPTKVYPWVLLVLLQVLMPGISFLGHLSGLLIGVLQANGLLGLCMPSAGFFKTLEATPACACITRSRQFVACPDDASALNQRSPCVHLFGATTRVWRSATQSTHAVVERSRAALARLSVPRGYEVVEGSEGALEMQIGQQVVDVENQQRIVL